MSRAALRILCHSVLVLVICLIASSAVSAQVVAPSAEPRVRLPRTIHPLVSTSQDLGPVASSSRMERMVLVLGPPDSKQAELRSFLDALQDKGSPSYHAWLTPQQFGERFGPSQADVDSITAWLQGQGFDSIKVAPGRSGVEFSGTAQIVERAFQTPIHSFSLAGNTHLANLSDISIPQSLAGAVRGLRLNNFSFSKPAFVRGGPLERDSDGHLVPTATDPSFAASAGNFIGPGDFARIYDLNRLYSNGVNGTGTSIAIVARSNISLNEVEVFRQAFNLAPNDPNIVLNGPDPGITLDGNDIEAFLDTEWSGAIAPNATVDVVVSASTSTTDGVLLSAAYIVDNNLAGIMSVSFEACEQSLGPDNALINALWQQAAAEGISVFVASGDQGAAGCDPNRPSPTPAAGGLGVNALASTPFNTAVGGTQFAENGNTATFWNATNGSAQVSVVGYIPEVVWNESCDPTKSASCQGLYSFASGGGGVSTIYTKPSWQDVTIPGMPNDGHRDVPDVSLAAAAHDGYIICTVIFTPCSVDSGSGQMLNAGFVGGTSASSPAFAGIMALVDQKQGGRQGLANYVLYKLAANESFAACNASNRTDPATPPPAACVFNDVTAGNNGVPGNDIVNAGLGYPATAGYDPGSGLGSVNATNLVNAWNTASFKGSVTALSATSATSIQHGQTVSFTGSVAPLSGTGVPGGNVAIVANTSAFPFSSSVGVTNSALASGTFSASTNALPGGTYNVTAHFPGDGVFAPSDSSPVQVTVTPESNTLTLTAIRPDGISLTDVNYGLPFLFHAVVTPASGNGVATGTVTLSEGGAPILQIPLDHTGVANLANCSLASPACLTFGQHTITASYSGDSSFTPSVTAQPLALNITHGPPSVFGAFLQTVEPFLFVFVQFTNTGRIPPTGTVTISDNTGGINTALGAPVVIQPGVPVTRQFILAPGVYTITASYSGDANYQPTSVTSAPFTFGSDSSPATRTTITPLTNPMVVGQPASFQVSVTSPSSSAPVSGLVQLLIDGQPFPNATAALPPVVNGAATVQGTISSGGSIIVANFLGDALPGSTFAPSVSPPTPVVILKATPSMVISASQQTAQPGQQVQLAARITGVPNTVSPQGLLQFLDAFNGSTPAPLGPPVIVFPSTSLISPGGSGNDVVTVVPFLLSAGVHVVTASFTGDTNYNGVASSNPTTIVVGGTKAVSTVILGSSNSQAVVGSALTFNVSVSPNPPGSGTPTGSVVFFDGASAISGSVPLVNGTASFTTATLAIGTHSMTAQYSGDGTFNPATSALLTQIITVQPVFQFVVPPGNDAVTVPAGQTAHYNFSLNANGFSGSVSFACTGAPSGSTCTVQPNPAALTGNNTVAVAVTVTTLTTAHLAKPGFTSLAVMFAGLLAFAIVGRKRDHKRTLSMFLLPLVMITAVSCGGGGSTGTPPPPPPPPSVFKITVTGTSGAVTNTVPLTLTLTH